MLILFWSCSTAEQPFSSFYTIFRHALYKAMPNTKRKRRSIKTQGLEMAPWWQCLLSTPANTSSNPQHPEKLSVAMHSCDLCVHWQAEAGRRQELSGLKRKPEAVGDPSPRLQDREWWRRTQKSSLKPYVRTHTHIYICKTDTILIHKTWKSLCSVFHFVYVMTPPFFQVDGSPTPCHWLLLWSL